MSVAFRQTVPRWSVAGLAAVLAAALMFVGSGEVDAQTYTWGAAGSTTATTNYNLGTNWSTPPAGAPPVAAGQSAVFDNTGSGAVSVSSGSVTVDAWTFNAGAQTYTFSGGAVNFNTATGLVDNSANDVTIRNNIGGIGTVTNAGTGTLTLTGVLSYTGLTSATGGSIILGDATGAATLPGNATLNGGNLAVANGSLGSGTININGGSALFVGFTAGLNATAGTATINNGGTVTFQNSATAGGAQINNTGLVDFADTATSANATILTTGTGLLQFRNSATAGNATISMGNGTSLTFGGNASGGTARLIVNTGGQLDISQTNAGIGTGSIEGGGDIFLGSKSLTVGGNNLSTSFSGVLQDGGVGAGAGGSLTKVGSGTLTLSGTNTYTGATTVNDGTLIVDGSIANSSGVTVNSGGTLGGIGTVAATTINNGAALAPGAGIGTITVNGNVIFNAGSKYNAEVSATTSDLTNVTGSANLAGGTVNATSLGATLGRRYTLLSATGGLGGTSFAGLSWPNFTGVLSYDANNAYLTLTGMALGSGTSLNNNQRNTASAISAFFNGGGTLPTGFTALFGQTGSQLGNSLNQLSGEASTGVQQSVFANADLFMSSVFANALKPAAVAAEQGAALGYAPRRNASAAAQDAYAAVTPRDRARGLDQRWNVWATGYGGNMRISGDAAAGSHETTSRVYGVAAGATYRASPDTTFGFALGGAGSTFDLGGGLGSGRVDTFNGGLYGRYAMGQQYVAAALAYAWHDAATDRTVTVAGTDTLHASFHPQALTARVETGRRYAFGGFGVIPYAGLQSTAFFRPAYGETATSGSSQFALNYASKTATATRTELGARWDKAVAVAGGTLTFEARTAWAHDWNTDRAATATFQTLPGATFTVYGAAPTADAALLSVGAQMAWVRGWSVAANFDGEFSAHSRGYGGKGSISYAW